METQPKTFETVNDLVKWWTNSFEEVTKNLPTIERDVHFTIDPKHTVSVAFRKYKLFVKELSPLEKHRLITKLSKTSFDLEDFEKVFDLLELLGEYITVINEVSDKQELGLLNDEKVYNTVFNDDYEELIVLVYILNFFNVFLCTSKLNKAKKN